MLWESARAESENGAWVKLVHAKIQINGNFYSWHDESDCSVKLPRNRSDNYEG